MNEKLKKYETIGACGIDCGLCPRFYTKGGSACPGCGGPDFKEKHPSCGVLSCALKQGFETCAECKDFPCHRLNSENAGYDSFVTHKKMISNLEEIKANGIECFIEKQKTRMDILNDLLTIYNDGRSTSFFCQTCALIPIDKLKEVHGDAKKNADTELKERNKRIKESITEIANSLDIDLKRSKKSKK
jgi:hypothetical protein